MYDIKNNSAKVGDVPKCLSLCFSLKINLYHDLIINYHQFKLFEIYCLYLHILGISCNHN